MYTVASAQLPEPPAGADRIFSTENSVIVLDGASSFTAHAPNPATYVDTLGQHLVDLIAANPLADLRRSLAEAIRETASDLRLSRGASPSSTVAVARWSEERVDLLVLGDTEITTPHGELRDDRLSAIGSVERAAYRARLAAGRGYDERHRASLAALQAEQSRWRNRADGYWIAEANPDAASEALIRSYLIASTPWLFLASDGAYGPMRHLGLIASPTAAPTELLRLLCRCERWEDETDPNGRTRPRAKRHDDKTIVALHRVGA